MINPFVDNLTDLTPNQLEEKTIDLQRKYFMTHNPQVQAQIAGVLEMYQQELQSRRAIEYQRQKDQQNGDNDLDSLINVS